MGRLRSAILATLVLGLAAVALADHGGARAADEPALVATVTAADDLSRATWRAKADGLDEPAPRADKLTIARRLSLTLTGSIPSLEEIRAIEHLSDEAALDHHLEHILASRRFADYLAERLARAYVGVDEGPFLVFRRRRFVYWLSDAIAAGVPYDVLVRQLIAGTGLWTDAPETNFVTAHERDAVRLTARTTRAFLGMRLDCAQCHDHPFSHWKQDDFMGLAAHYAGIEQTVTGIEDGSVAEAPARMMGAMMMREEPDAHAPSVPFAEAAYPARGDRRERLARWVTSPDNPVFGQAIANRMWTLMLGRSLTLTGVDDIEGDERIEGMLATLGADFVAHGHDLRRLIRVIAHSRAFTMQSRDDASAEMFASYPMTRLRADQVAGALVQLSQLATVDADSHILVRLMRVGTANDFGRRYGDGGEDELRQQAGTLAQRLVLMNGKVVRERAEANLFSAPGRIASLSPDDHTRVRTAYLVVLTREPSVAELEHFTARLAGKKGDVLGRAIEDLLWALINTTEFTLLH